ncbi:MAG: bifunctional demethylmenaquinone methyltransferase/2-methoxy-6-polyprenyl-1,4-benzoquinol methylase UbiE [Cytophagaceae bacterium]|jgi:demethylmenaquinone methyltransferase/2-methoxy-6-polyprenyl-1,4-benzoquinol methylase|nr:bifunctional demethylmenaquinone methyltransferase/2-methoxy-6-polyprenyl-1,4-benzoquinol methylase UbiE [Cytophagaceae bacterium]
MAVVVPYKDQQEGKKKQISQMFNSISGKYDLLNRVLSLGIDKSWRRAAIREVSKEKPQLILDVATGTADLAIAAMKATPKKVIGVDISDQMLEIGRKKITKLGLDEKIELLSGDSEQLQFPDNNFDAVIVSFGVRNFENLEKGLSEINRVLKPGGKLVVLEFSKPEKFPFKQIYQFYFRFILPIVGRLVSKDGAAYTYLPESVNSFPYGKAFTDIMVKLGYQRVQCNELTFGVSSLYVGYK